MEDFNGVVRVDFKEAREKSGLNKDFANEIFKEVSFSNISIDDVESGDVKLSENDVDTLMGMYGVPEYLKKDYHEKYSPKF
ncbi:MAG: hypothetical protein MJ245_07455 [Clostridia bacterium]|nr:hypothetical protein [Clostridia bacterium]